MMQWIGIYREFDDINHTLILSDIYDVSRLFWCCFIPIDLFTFL